MDDDEDEEELQGSAGEINEEERKKIWERYDQNKRNQTKRNIYGEMDDEEIAQYAKNLDAKYYQEEEEQDDADEAKSIYPTRADPTLWLMKCKQGSEREACICLMNKYLALKQQGKPLSIISATVSDKVQGHLYIEAFKEIHVRAAVKGLNLIYQRECIRIKNEETASVFEMDKASKITMKKGQWVRITTGLYTGDYAKVIGVDESKAGCYVKLIPRLNVNTEEVKSMADKRKAMAHPERPSLKFFNREQMTGVQEKYSPIFNKQMQYWKRNYYRKGFLFKYFNIKNLEVENIIPPRFILEKFLKPNENEDDEEDPSDEDPEQERENWKKSVSENISLTKGDNIKVIHGDLQNLTGTVVAINKKVITMKPDLEDIPENLDLDIKMISKHFEKGDHVYVIEGEHEGDKGIITKVRGDQCIIFSDVRQKELIANLNN